MKANFIKVFQDMFCIYIKADHDLFELTNHVTT
jgi:hypothetical protein